MPTILLEDPKTWKSILSDDFHHVYKKKWYKKGQGTSPLFHCTIITFGLESQACSNQTRPSLIITQTCILLRSIKIQSPDFVALICQYLRPNFDILLLSFMKKQPEGSFLQSIYTSIQPVTSKRIEMFANKWETEKGQRN